MIELVAPIQGYNSHEAVYLPHKQLCFNSDTWAFYLQNSPFQFIN